MMIRTNKDESAPPDSRWTALDDDTYNGIDTPLGMGPTQLAAVADLLAKLDRGFLPEDYQCTAELLRYYMNREDQSLFRAMCSNKLSIILSALDVCGEETGPLRQR